jgi:hypothetical protein
MSDALMTVLESECDDDDAVVTRILATAFFTKRPLQAGSSANVVFLTDVTKTTGRQTHPNTRSTGLSCRKGGGRRR